MSKKTFARQPNSVSLSPTPMVFGHLVSICAMVISCVLLAISWNFFPGSFSMIAQKKKNKREKNLLWYLPGSPHPWLDLHPVWCDAIYTKRREVVSVHTDRTWRRCNAKKDVYMTSLFSRSQEFIVDLPSIVVVYLFNCDQTGSPSLHTQSNFISSDSNLLRGGGQAKCSAHSQFVPPAAKTLFSGRFRG